MGHLNGFWPGEIGILNNSFQQSQMLAPLMRRAGGGAGNAYSDDSGNSQAKPLTGSR